MPSPRSDVAALDAPVARSSGDGARSVEPLAPRERSGPSAIELAAAGVLFVVVAAVLLTGHIGDAGMYTDDWPIAAIWDRHGTGGLIEQLFTAGNNRPVGAVYLGVMQAIVGTDGTAHAIAGLLAHVFRAWAFYWFLRTVALGRWAAGTIVVIALLFPAFNATWLWFSASHSAVAVGLALLGFVAAVNGLRSQGRRGRVLHAVAVVLYVLSVFTYEAAAVAIVAGIVVYWPQTDRRRALKHWIADVAVVGFALLLPRTGLLPGDSPHDTVALSDQLRHARDIADQTMTVMTNAAMPFGAPHRNVVLPVLAVIVAVAIAVWVARRRGGTPPVRALGRWLGVIASGLLVISVAYVIFVPASPDFYQPAAAGSDNRINALAGLGYCMIVFGIAMTIATLLAMVTRRPQLGIGVAVALCAFVAVGYADRTRDDVDAWERAGTSQDEDFERLTEIVGRPPRWTTLYVFGATGMTAPGVYAFRVTWDLDAAVQLEWDDDTLHAYPIFEGTAMVCGADGVHPEGPGNGNGPAQTAAYGNALLVDLRDGREVRPRSQRACERAVGRFQPGPLY